MNIGDFFDFGSKLSPTTFQVHPEGLLPRREGTEESDAHRLASGDFDRIDFPVTFRYARGRKLCDVLDTGYSALYVISERMRAALTKGSISGWKCFPITVFGRSGEPVGGYHGFSVTGRCGPIDLSRSEIIYKQPVPGGPTQKYFRGKYFGADEWDHYDFFLPRGHYGPIVTRRAAELMRSVKLTNVHLTNLTDWEIDEMTAAVIAERSR